MSTSTALVVYEPPKPTRAQAAYRTKTERYAVARRVFARIVGGAKVSKACHLEGITWAKLWRWMELDEELSLRYARARKASAYAWEDKSTDAVEKATPKTAVVAKMKDDNYRWRARVASPRTHGEKLDVTSDDKPLAPAQIITIGGRSITF